MIIDTLTQAEKYYSIHPRFKVAFEYLLATDLAGVETGVVEIADGVKAIISAAEGRTAETAAKTFECHNQNIDIQVCIRGHETIGWKPRRDCQQPQAEYSAEKDVLFFHDVPDMHFALKAGQFVVFFPEDVHAPMIGDGLIKKLVVKVRIED